MNVSRCLEQNPTITSTLRPAIHAGPSSIDRGTLPGRLNNDHVRQHVGDAQLQHLVEGRRAGERVRHRGDDRRVLLVPDAAH